MSELSIVLFIKQMFLNLAFIIIKMFSRLPSEYQKIVNKGWPRKNVYFTVVVHVTKVYFLLGHPLLIYWMLYYFKHFSPVLGSQVVQAWVCQALVWSINKVQAPVLPMLLLLQLLSISFQSSQVYLTYSTAAKGLD